MYHHAVIVALYIVLMLYVTDEDKARDREARSSGRNTPTRRTPRGSRERLSAAGDAASENLDNSSQYYNLRHTLRLSYYSMWDIFCTIIGS